MEVNEATPSPASHPDSGPGSTTEELRPIRQDTTFSIGALIRVKHAVIAQRRVEGRGSKGPCPARKLPVALLKRILDFSFQAQ